LAYPIDDLTNVHLNASTDDPSQARAELNALLLKVQAMIAATGTGISEALKLDSNGDIPTGVGHADNVPIADGGTGAATAPNALINLGLTAVAAEINYNNISTLGISEASKTVTTNSSNSVSFGNISFIPPTTGGTSAAYTVTIGITAYETNRMYEAKIHTINVINPTINFDGLGAKSIKVHSSNIGPLAGQLNGFHKFYYDGTNIIVMNPRWALRGCVLDQTYGGQGISNNVLTKISYDSESFDPESMHSLSTNPAYAIIPSNAYKARARLTVTFPAITANQNILIQIKYGTIAGSFELVAQQMMQQWSTAKAGQIYCDTGVITVGVGKAFETWIHHTSGATLIIAHQLKVDLLDYDRS